MLALIAMLLSGAALAASPEVSVYYSQLTDGQKQMYDVLNSPEGREKLRSGGEIRLPVITGGSITRDGLDALVSGIYGDVGYAFVAFELDHPEFFWLMGYNSNVYASYDSSSYRIEPTLTVRFEPNWANGSRSIAEDEYALASVVSQLATYIDGAESADHAKLMLIHDWLITNCVYNSYAAANIAYSDYDYLPWSPLSSLLGAADPVCEGYARAFKLVCDALGIPCILVDGWAGGGGHMWNQVKLGGKWYAVDATWDDTAVNGISAKISGYEKHDYFLVGSGTFDSNQRAFSETHTVNGERMPGIIMAVPEISGYAFDPNAPQLPTVTRQDIPVTGTCYESTQTVTVDGVQKILPAYKLLDEYGNDTNYVRLRDLAYMLDGTAAQFDVMWTDEYGITIFPGQSYLHPNGTENSIPFSGDQSYTAYLEDTTVGYVQQPLTAFQIEYMGGGHTYFQVRDMAKALNFFVDWDDEIGIVINTDMPYPSR